MMQELKLFSVLVMLAICSACATPISKKKSLERVYTLDEIYENRDGFDGKYVTIESYIEYDPYVISSPEYALFARYIASDVRTVSQKTRTCAVKDVRSVAIQGVLWPKYFSERYARHALISGTYRKRKVPLQYQMLLIEWDGYLEDAKIVRLLPGACSVDLQ